MATTNTFLTLADITYMSADVLSNSLGFTKTVNRNYDDRFARTGAKIGATTNMRLPSMFKFSSGSAIDIQALNDAYMPLTLNTLYQRAFAIDSVDMTLSVDDFAGRYLKPAMISMANQIDRDGLALAKQYAANEVGTFGSAPATQAAYNALVRDARVKLANNLAPEGEKKYIVAGPEFIGAGSVYNTNVFNPTAGISTQNVSGLVTSWGGFDWLESQMAPAHTVGTYSGTPKVNGVGQSGSSLVVDGFGAGSFLNQGDVFTISGVYAINAQTKESYDYLQQFTVTAKTATGTGFTVQISPAIVGPTDPRQNVSALPADNADITVAGASGASTQFAFGYHENAFVFGTADLDAVVSGADAYRASLPELGLSLRVVKQFDIRSNQLLMRLDLLGGWAPLYPQLSTKIVTK